MSSQRSAVVLGATGLVSRALVSFLLREPSILSVVAVVRRGGGLAEHPKLRVAVADFEQLERHAEHFRVDQVLCALGTTMRQAGTRERFRRVDYDYPVIAGHVARAQGATHYLLVSALGANPGSRVFYNQVKGETEAAISRLGFPSVTIARPSLLVGPRTEVRVGERIGHVLGWLLPKGLRPIAADDVAAALTLAARESRHGVRLLTPGEMRGAANQLSNS